MGQWQCCLQWQSWGFVYVNAGTDIKIIALLEPQMKTFPSLSATELVHVRVFLASTYMTFLTKNNFAFSESATFPMLSKVWSVIVLRPLQVNK